MDDLRYSVPIKFSSFIFFYSFSDILQRLGAMKDYILFLLRSVVSKSKGTFSYSRLVKTLTDRVTVKEEACS